MTPEMASKTTASVIALAWRTLAWRRTSTRKDDAEPSRPQSMETAITQRRANTSVPKEPSRALWEIMVGPTQ